jgi:adenylate cyclase
MISRSPEPFSRLLRTGLFISVVWCPIALLIVLLWPSPFEEINHRIYDLKLSLLVRYRPPDLSPEIIHLDIDDEAIRTVGAWPWDREVFARIVDRLREYRARLVVFDILYPQPRSTEGDKAFVRSVAEAGNTITSVAFGLRGPEKDTSKDRVDQKKFKAVKQKAWKLEMPKEARIPKASTFRDTLVPLAPLADCSRYVGHIIATEDSDGIHRRTPPLIALKDRFLPSLALAALAAYWNLPPQAMKINGEGDLEIEHGGKTLTVPLDSRGMMLVNWTWPLKKFSHYSVADLLSNDNDPKRPARYRDKIVIVGLTLSGATDFGATPLAHDTPLSRLHSSSLNTIMNGRFIREIKPYPVIVPLAVVVTLLFLLMALRMSLRRSIVIAAALCVGSAVVTVAVFLWGMTDVGLAEPLFMFVPAAGLLLTVKSVATELEGMKASWALRRYFPAEVIKQVLADPVASELPAKRKELSIVFVDIEGSTGISETAEVEYVKDFFNEFYEAMVDAVFSHGGTVDKFLGDGLLAFFGDPVPLDNHALSAVRAAVDMQQKMSRLSTKWAESGIREFRSGLRIRIGINTGLVLVGNVGSDRRMEYTVMGSAVNVASRLEATAPAGGIRISARTHALVKDEIQCEGPEWIKVKGISGELEVYLVTSPVSFAEHAEAADPSNETEA